MHVWMCGCVDVWMCRCVDVYTRGCVDAWKFAGMDAEMRTWMDAWMDLGGAMAREMKETGKGERGREMMQRLGE